MRVVPQATLVADLGLRDDMHAHPRSRRQVLVADREVLDALDLRPGSIKENLTVEALHVMRLPAGTRLHIGASVVLEITSECEPCFRMDEIRAGLQLALQGRRGMNTRVVAGGLIAHGDPIHVDVPQHIPV